MYSYLQTFDMFGVTETFYFGHHQRNSLASLELPHTIHQDRQGMYFEANQIGYPQQ